jgi:hypothetical protein
LPRSRRGSRFRGMSRRCYRFMGGAGCSEPCPIQITLKHSSNRAEGSRGRGRFRNENDLRIGGLARARFAGMHTARSSELDQSIDTNKSRTERKTASPASQSFRNRTRPRPRARTRFHFPTSERSSLGAPETTSRSPARHGQAKLFLPHKIVSVPDGSSRCRVRILMRNLRSRMAVNHRLALWI